MESGPNSTVFSVCAAAKESDPERASSLCEKMKTLLSVPSCGCCRVAGPATEPLAAACESYGGARAAGPAHLDGVLLELLCPDLSNAQLKAVKLGLISGVRTICEKKENRASFVKRNVLVMLHETNRPRKQTKDCLRINDSSQFSGFLIKELAGFHHAIT